MWQPLVAAVVVLEINKQVKVKQQKHLKIQLLTACFLQGAILTTMLATRNFSGKICRSLLPKPPTLEFRGQVKGQSVSHWLSMCHFMTFDLQVCVSVVGNLPKKFTNQLPAYTQLAG
ncbi:hypothetical protein AMECASPLE_039158 [Ameca splendens]|uniref:Uncharacterized protein n=1 Tax=Ameca splendens TaxID=208324 RepID=A0ABV0YX12_9TELE